MKIELHLLQNFVPSCLNRDDTNTPKSCDFGGVTRSRISSQCFKRAVRSYFADNNIASVGTRSKRIKAALTDKLKDAGKDEAELSAALDIFVQAFYSDFDKEDRNLTKVLIFFSDYEMDEAAKCVLDYWPDIELALKQKAIEEAKAAEKKKSARTSDRGQEAEEKKIPKLPDAIRDRLQDAKVSADIALFGRMLAGKTETNIDAACQVAHSLSTHGIDLEMDFYTAVDDLNRKDETGAGMLGVTGYTSACFYRYALLDRDQLIKNLKGDDALADQVVAAFLEAFVCAIPTGKQNSMAAHNPPDFGMFIVRDKGVPCSLANAFARPVFTDRTDVDVVGDSIDALAEYWTSIQKTYGLYDKDKASISLFHTGFTNRLGELRVYNPGSLQAAIDATMQAIRGEKPEAQA